VNVTNRRILLASLKVYDLALLTISYAMATVLTFRVGGSASFAHFLSIRVKLSNCLIFAGILLAWHVILLLCRLYESKRLSTRKEKMVGELKAIIFATICLLLVAISFSIQMVTPSFLILFWGISSMGMVGSRFLLRGFLGHVRRKGRDLRHVLIVGTNSRAVAFARRIAATPEWGYNNLGFVDEDWAGSERFKKSGFAMVTNRRRLAEFLRDNVVDEVAIYLPLRSCYENAAQVASLCEQHGITVRCESDIFGIHAARTWRADIDEEHVVATLSAPHDGLSLVVKRVLDIACALTLLILLSPLLALVALLIKVTSKGPVFFRQERIGLNKRRFRIFKFRTMVPGAERMLASLERFNEVSGPVFKIKKDPRITPIGIWLRRASVDELPQLLNVLMGDMSLVGPRPLPVHDYQGFGKDWQRRRFCVRPGITCLWQVQGRSSIGFEQWMKLDLQYLDQWSLWLDLKILARTIPAVLKGTGAA
jgi:exopolysaccharide biosynthesis polyprenyl glycosylphosphotransferase